MKTNAKPIPEGYQTLTPLLTVQNANAMLSKDRSTIQPVLRRQNLSPDQKA